MELHCLDKISLVGIEHEARIFIERMYFIQEMEQLWYLRMVKQRQP